MSFGEFVAPNAGFLRAGNISLPATFTRPLCDNPVLLAAWQVVYFSVFMLASYVIVTNYIFETVQVVGPSMLPTLHDTDHYLLNRLAYRFRNPLRSEIVVIRDPGDEGYSVKQRASAAPDPAPDSESLS